MLSRRGINVRNYSDCLRSNITMMSARTHAYNQCLCTHEWIFKVF